MGLGGLADTTLQQQDFNTEFAVDVQANLCSLALAEVLLAANRFRMGRVPTLLHLGPPRPSTVFLFSKGGIQSYVSPKTCTAFWSSQGHPTFFTSLKQVCRVVGIACCCRPRYL